MSMPRLEMGISSRVAAGRVTGQRAWERATFCCHLLSGNWLAKCNWLKWDGAGLCHYILAETLNG